MDDEQALTIIVRADLGPTMEDLASAADSVARATALGKYRKQRTNETLRRQRADLDAFKRYLQQAGGVPGDLMNYAREVMRERLESVR